MNEKQLKSFVRAAELGSFSKAAKEASVSSPSLIGQINTLEKEYGYPLFKRSTHSIDLTPSGEVLYLAVKEMNEVFEHFKQVVSGKPEPKILNIAAAGSRAEELDNFSKRFEEKHPDVDVRLQSFNPEDGVLTDSSKKVKGKPDKNEKTQIYFCEDVSELGMQGMVDGQLGMVISKDADLTTLQFITDFISQLRSQSAEKEQEQ